MKVKIGTLLVLETGEYSSYTFHGPFRVIKSFDEADVVARYRAQWTSSDEYDQPSPEGFTSWLTAQGFIRDASQVLNWHIGSYGELEAYPHTEPSQVLPPT